METKLISVNPRDLKLLEVNARFMRHEQFQQLVANIQKDETLTSVPFGCLEPDGSYLILSGNHRVKAAIAAGIEEIKVMVTEEELSKDRKIAIQLSHNAIAGEDDPAILKQLYEVIGDLDSKIYAGLDDKTLELLENVNIDSFADPNLNFQTITMLFLPEELDEAQQVFTEVKALLGSMDSLWITRWAEYDAWLDTLDTIGASYQVKNVATTVMLMLNLVKRHITDLQEGYLDSNGEPTHNGWVPLDTIIGQTRIPAASAAVVKKAVDKMRSVGDISKDNLWQAIEYWAADCLASSDAPKEPEPAKPKKPREKKKTAKKK